MGRERLTRVQTKLGSVTLARAGKADTHEDAICPLGLALCVQKRFMAQPQPGLCVTLGVLHSVHLHCGLGVLSGLFIS